MHHVNNKVASNTIKELTRIPLTKCTLTGLHESQMIRSPANSEEEEKLVSVLPLSQTRHFRDERTSASFLLSILCVSLRLSLAQSPSAAHTDVTVHVAAPHVLSVSTKRAAKCVNVRCTLQNRWNHYISHKPLRMHRISAVFPTRP